MTAILPVARGYLLPMNAPIYCGRRNHLSPCGQVFEYPPMALHRWRVALNEKEAALSPKYGAIEDMLG